MEYLQSLGKWSAAMIRHLCRFSAVRVPMFAILALVVPSGCMGQISFSVSSDLTLVEPANTQYIIQAGYAVNIRFETADHRVDLNGGNGETFLIQWTMRLSRFNKFGGELFIDSDGGGSYYFVQTAGHWEHLAHGTGVLSGNQMCASGSYRAFGKSRIDATRNPPAGEKKWENYEVEKALSVVPG